MERTEYLQSEKELPFPRKLWICKECGFELALMQGYNPDFNSPDYGAIVTPKGKCLKCKKEIFINENKVEDTRRFRALSKR